MALDRTGMLQDFLHVVEAASPAWQKWYAKNKEKFKEQVKEHTKKRRVELRDLIAEKKDAPCSKCGEKYHPSAMDLVHKDNEEKLFRISESSRSVYSLDKLNAELDKCYLICSNCNKERQMKKYLKETKGTETRNRRRKKLLEIVNEIKNVPCVKCKKKFPPYILELDHVATDKKTDSIARMVNQERPLSVIVDELTNGKIRVMCSNCHRVRTYKQSHG